MKDDDFSPLKKRLMESSHSNTSQAWERLRAQLPGTTPPPVRVRWMWRTTMTALSGAIAATLAVVVLTKNHREVPPQLVSNTTTIRTSPPLEDPELLENLDLMLDLEDHLEGITETPSENSTPGNGPGATMPSFWRNYALYA